MELQTEIRLGLQRNTSFFDSRSRRHPPGAILISDKSFFSWIIGERVPSICIFFIADPGERKEVEKKIGNLTHSGRNEQRRLIFRKGGRL
ncbi:MAG: hypothetical protein C4530_24245 [Desulfobacteraceae bacterium]|nr:MAG: hypothetical protein C4530_24245 [Desulfobacteraceae bacterium]